MRNVALILIGSLLWCVQLSSLASTPQRSTQVTTVTLYSLHKYPGEPKNFGLNFETGVVQSRFGPCDLRYGNLYAGDELDWFESSTAQGNRSVIKDLGDHDWTAQFEVPVVEPVPELKPGEQRRITIDTSGADGADGAPGPPGRPGTPVSANPSPSVPPAAPRSVKTTRPKNDGKPKVDPLFVKAVVGHMYVIHVVDAVRDFYALFHVEALGRGDNCTISWRLIPAPENEMGRQPR